MCITSKLIAVSHTVDKLVSRKSITVSHTKCSGFTHQNIVVSHTNHIAVLPTTLAPKAAPMLRYKKCNNARASFIFISNFNSEAKPQRGFATPLHSLQESKAVGMCAKRTYYLFLVAVTTNQFTCKALLFKPFFLKSTSKKSVIKRTHKGRGA